MIKSLNDIVAKRSNLPAMGEVSKQIVSSHTAENAAQSIMDAIRIAQKHCKR